MKIGLLSDTHGFLDPKVFDHFRDCDEIWHAGDIGTLEVAERLASFKPLRAVYGNIDDKELYAAFRDFGGHDIDVLIAAFEETKSVTLLNWNWCPSETPSVPRCCQFASI